NDLERGADAGGAPHAEAAVDRGRAIAHVPQPLTEGLGVGREAFAVVLDGHEPLARGASADDDVGPSGVRVAADVAEPLLDDAEDLDLLVRREADRRV